MEENTRKTQFKERAALAARSYRQLARVFSSYVTDAVEKQEEEYRVLHAVTEKVCAECPQYGQCWEDRQENCQDAFCYIAEYTKKMGRLENAVLPEYLKSYCIMERKLVEEWNRMLEVERMKKAAFSQIMEGKEALIRQLEETANCFLRISEEADKKKKELPREEEKELIAFLKK